ncbi:MAG: rod shape-determining protein MreC [Crocinitomicaceae bacterium]|nr:rod shape-determining protein MreC [Crocinitomicaceae bacterium]MDG1735562.1 rod shape-determining protein MreC [Crocinitomicaceae bacterium]
MQNLIAFIKRLRYFLVFVGLQFFALSMYVSYMSAPRSSYFTTASYISGSLFEFRHQITQHFNLEKNNKSLQEENIALRKSSSVFLYNKSRTEAHVEDSIYAQQYDYIPGTILNVTTTKRNNFFTLNIGEIHGVKKGMGVFSSNGVVGIIHNTSKHFSVIKSVLTSNINIDVLISEVGVSGMLKWDGVNDNIGSISGVSNDITVPKGSTVVTRGGSGIFPRGIPVGRIKHTKTVEGEASWHIDLSFSQKYAALENVYVVKNLFLEEFTQIQN